MTKEFIERMTAEQLEKAHAAYSQIAIIYEDVCGGPYKAREYREYFGVMDNRENIKRRFRLLITNSDGNKGDATPQCGAN